MYFLHYRPWISPWLKYIFNVKYHFWRTRITIVMRSVINCDVISRTETEWVRNGVSVWRSFYITRYVFIISGSVRNSMMLVHSWRSDFMRSLECYFGVYFPRFLAMRGIHTKIILPWKTLSLRLEYKPGILGMITLGICCAWNFGQT